VRHYSLDVTPPSAPEGSAPFVRSLSASAGGRPPAGQGERAPLEEELRQAEERNRTLVEQLPQVTYIEQLDGESASYISPQIEALVGYAPAGVAS